MVIAENDTLSQIEIEFAELCINGKRYYYYDSIKIPPQAKLMKDLSFSSLVSSLNESSEPIESLIAKLRIWNEDKKVEIGTFDFVIYQPDK